MTSVLTPSGVVLIYHRVTRSDSDLYALRVQPKHFEEQLQVIRELANPVPLREIAHGVRNGTLPKRAVAITFDDGYEDNLNCVKPLLEKYDIPATVFMTTGTIGRKREFWWDELERILLRPGSLPRNLEIQLDGKTHAWDLGDAAEYTEQDRLRDVRWSMADPHGGGLPPFPTARQSAFHAIYMLLQPLTREGREAVLDQLLAQGRMPQMVRPEYRALGDEEIVELGKGGLVEIGAHTVNHPALSRETVEAQRREIRESKHALEERLGRPVTGFAYPYGLYSADSVDEVRNAGFDYACACNSQLVRANSDPLLIPRIDVFDVDGEQFSRQLQTCLKGRVPN